MPQSSPWQALSRGEKGKLLTALNSWPFIVALGHQFSLGKKTKRVSKWRATGHINMWGIENKQFIFISLSCNHGENIWYVPVQLFPHCRRFVHIRKLIYFKYLKESDLKFNNKIKKKALGRNLSVLWDTDFRVFIYKFFIGLQARGLEISKLNKHLSLEDKTWKQFLHTEVVP